MTFRVDDDPGNGLVRVTLQGVYDKREIEQMVSHARERAAVHGWNILYDMRAAIPGNMGPGDIYWFPRDHPALKRPGALSVRVAALHVAERASLARFWEDSFRNAGLDARAFTDEAAAIAWLGGRK